MKDAYRTEYCIRQSPRKPYAPWPGPEDPRIRCRKRADHPSLWIRVGEDKSQHVALDLADWGLNPWVLFDSHIDPKRRGPREGLTKAGWVVPCN